MTSSVGNDQDSFSALVLVESSAACDSILAEMTNRQHLSFTSALRAAIDRASQRSSQLNQTERHSSGLSPPARPTLSLPSDHAKDWLDDPATAPPSVRPPPAPPDNLPPAGEVDSGELVVSTVSDDDALPVINLRMESRSQLVPMGPEEAQELLSSTVSNKTTGKITHNGKSVDTYEEFRAALDKSMYPRNFEFFNQPVVIIAAVWVGEPDVAASLGQLADPPVEHLPAAFRDGLLDMAAPTSYLLIQRANNEQDASCASRALSSARAAFGPTGAQLIVLSDESENQQETTALDQGLVWAGKPQSDLDVLARELSQRMIRECIETHTYTLYAHVDKVKRGVKNTFKSWFKSSERPKAAGANGKAQFLANSVESRIRCLADGFFLLQDYEQALAHYRLVAHDFYGMGAAVHHASAMEMAGICLVRMRGSRREITAAFDSAIESYSKGGFREAVVRATMRLVDFCVINGLPDTASGVLMKGIGSLTVKGKIEGVDWLLHAAVLLHKLSLCHLLHRKPRKRKSALYSFFAAERYSAAGQTRLALSCYDAVVSVSKGLGMDFLEDHVNFAQGRGHSQLNNSREAFEHFHQVLGDTRQPASFQLDLLTSLFAVKTPNNETREMSPSTAHFPIVRDDSVYIETRDQCYDVSWRELEREFVEVNTSCPDGDTRYHRSAVPFQDQLLRTSPFKQSTRYSHPGTGIAGEEFFIVFEIRNPLLMAVHMTDTKAILSYIGDGVPPVAVNLDRIDLPPRSRIVVRLAVQPQDAGEVTVLGFEWTLRVKVYEEEHICPCNHTITRQGQRKNSSRAERCSSPTYSPDRSLNIRIARRAPYIEATMRIDSLADYVREGETWKGSILIANTGSTSAKDVRVLSGNPSSLFCSKGPPETPRNIAVTEGSSLELACWLRAPSTGGKSVSVTLRILVGYLCPTVDSKEMKWRLCRAKTIIRVQPCLVAFPRFLRYNPFSVARHSEEYLLGVEIEHAWTEGEETYEIYSVGTLAAPSWQTNCLPEPVSSESFSSTTPNFELKLRVNETATLFVSVAEAKDYEKDRRSQFVQLPIGLSTMQEKDIQDMSIDVREKFFSSEQRTSLPVDQRSVWVAIFWREVVTGAVGELYLPSLIPSEWVDDGARTLAPAQIAMQDLVDGPILKVSFEVERVVEFSKSGLPLLIPVRVRVYNRGDFVVDARVTASPSGIADESRGRSWCGDTLSRIRHLAPGATRLLDLNIVVNGPGIYNVSDLIVEPVKSKTGSGYVHTEGREFAEVEECRLQVVPAT